MRRARRSLDYVLGRCAYLRELEVPTNFSAGFSLRGPGSTDGLHVIVAGRMGVDLDDQRSQRPLLTMRASLTTDVSKITRLNIVGTVGGSLFTRCWVVNLCNREVVTRPRLVMGKTLSSPAEWGR